MSRGAKVISALILVLAVVIVWPVSAHFQAKKKVANYKKQLQARGEKFNLEEIVPMPPPESQNGGPLLIAAARQFAAPSAYGSNYPPIMKNLGPGRAWVAWKQPILPNDEITNVWPGLEAMVAADANVLAEVRAALERPRIAFHLNYREGFRLQVAHLPQLKGLAQWLSAAALVDLHEGNWKASRENLIALAALVERYRDEPIMISELVRLAMSAIALTVTWEALQWPQPDEEALKRLQTSWAAVDFLTQAESVLAMERLIQEGAFAESRGSYSTIANWTSGAASAKSGLSELVELGKEALDNPKEAFQEIAHRYPAYWAWKYWFSYDEELANFKMIQAAIEAVRQAKGAAPFVPTLKRFEQESKQIRQAYAKAGNWLGLPSASAERFLGRVVSMEMQRTLLVTAIALKRYHLKHGRYPPALADLAPELIPKTPRDPMDGQPLRYRLDSDGSFLLYSVGEDGEDNGGNAGPVHAAGGTVSSAAKQWAKGRDAVWPWPGTDDEVRMETEKVTKAALARLATNELTAFPKGLDAGQAEAFRRRYGLQAPGTTNK